MAADTPTESLTDPAQFDIEWIDAGYEPRSNPNPAYPDGVDVDMSGGLRHCTVKLAYPALRIGSHVIKCLKCGIVVGVTSAGRRDDPRSVKLPCKDNCPSCNMTNHNHLDICPEKPK